MKQSLRINLLCFSLFLYIVFPVYADNTHFIDSKDHSYLLDRFGDILPVEENLDVDHRNPHAVASQSVFLIKEGRVQDALRIFPHVERDDGGMEATTPGDGFQADHLPYFGGLRERG